MTPSQQAKQQGLKNLAEVSQLTGVDRQTLDNWANHKQALFEIVLLGCKVKNDNEQTN